MAETERNRTDAVHGHGCDVAAVGAGHPAMDDGLFTVESDYQAGLSVAKGLLRQGLLTEGEFQRTKALLLEKYRPPIGTLLAEAG